jgi:hypothetical protein
MGLIKHSTLGDGKSKKDWSYMRGWSYSVGGSYIPVSAVRPQLRLGGCGDIAALAGSHQQCNIARSRLGTMIAI